MTLGAIPKQTESGFLAAVVEYAELMGWRCHHVFEQRHYAKRIGPGFPDLCMVRFDRVVFAELKVGKNTLSQFQHEWADDLRSVARRAQGAVTYKLWRPEDWDEIQEVLR